MSSSELARRQTFLEFSREQALEGLALPNLNGTDHPIAEISNLAESAQLATIHRKTGTVEVLGNVVAGKVAVLPLLDSDTSQKHLRWPADLYEASTDSAEVVTNLQVYLHSSNAFCIVGGGIKMPLIVLMPKLKSGLPQRTGTAFAHELDHAVRSVDPMFMRYGSAVTQRGGTMLEISAFTLAYRICHAHFGEQYESALKAAQRRFANRNLDTCLFSRAANPLTRYIMSNVYNQVILERINAQVGAQPSPRQIAVLHAQGMH